MSAILATYVHHLDPVAVGITESFGIRWYGLAYVAAFVGAFLLLRWFAKLGTTELKREEVADFVTLIALCGVMLGGRLGYLLLYRAGDFFSNPLIFFDFLGGGMSSHGGIAGICLVAYVYARRTGKSWTGLGDHLVIVSTLGVFFGRIANFVNGELYGRPTEGRLAVKFPDELHERVATPQGVEWRFPLEQLRGLAEDAAEVAPDLLARVDRITADAIVQGYHAHYAVAELLKETARENPAFRELLGAILTPRHPSQLYEALVEGLLLFVLLLAARLRWRQLRHGVLTGLFFILYAIGRISVETLREPDAGTILGMTRGQFYSLFMLLAGVGFLAWARFRGGGPRAMLEAGAGVRRDKRGDSG